MSVRADTGTERHPRADGFRHRAACYAKLIADVAQLHGIGGRGRFFFDMKDLVTETYYMPVCTYQRMPGQSTLCFPDIEFLIHDYYETAGPGADDKPFAEKANKAAFIGSSTGYPYLLGRHNIHRLPRLKSALFFKDKPQIDFELTGIVQTDGAATDEAIAALGVSAPSRRFEALYDNKFIISMDGNGATCSRVAMALRSNSVLLKYQSEWELFYFPMLVPWLHYIPIQTDEDVLRIVDHETQNPGAFAHIAAAGSIFYYKHLSRHAIYRYTAELLKTYNAIFFPADLARR